MSIMVLISLMNVVIYEIIRLESLPPSELHQMFFVFFNANLKLSLYIAVQ